MKEILIQTINTVIYLAVIFIIVRAVLSFFPALSSNRDHPVIRFLYVVTDPLLNLFRNILPTSRIGLDFSPLFAYFVLEIIRFLLLTIVDKLF